VADEASRLRLFAAISIPRDRLDHVAEVIDPIRPRLPGARWTDPANQHVTLKFFGWVDSELAESIHSACAAVASLYAPGELALGELGAFPTLKRMRVLWVGLEDPAGLLASLAAGLEAALEPLGFEAERRAFTPHLTLARMKTPLRPTGGFPAPQFDRMVWTCDAFTLYRSHLSPKGARYEALASFPLGA
jgi:RNA 2',3'-cyclic 3'-phosphodiesterase